MKFAVTIEEIEKWTADMVRIPSYPGIPNQEMEVAKYIKSVFDAEGIDCHIDELDDGRANAVAVLKGKGAGKNTLPLSQKYASYKHAQNKQTGQSIYGKSFFVTFYLIRKLFVKALFFLFCHHIISKTEIALFYVAFQY